MTTIDPRNVRVQVEVACPVCGATTWLRLMDWRTVGGHALMLSERQSGAACQHLGGAVTVQAGVHVEVAP